MRLPAIALLCSLAFAPETFADQSSSSFEVGPTTVDLTPSKAGLFYIANRGSAEVTVQIQTMDWQQAGNADKLTASNEFFASPLWCMLPPGNGRSCGCWQSLPIRT